jgi:rhamnose utilization protein RhaD (predicted bifunctional aldolase and dehydrogenase)
MAGLDGSELRPSIETALHALLPHRFVFHVHAVGAISAGLSDEGVSRLRSSGEDFILVPYAKPGIELARAVSALLPEVADPSEVLVLLLRDHGIVVGAPSAEEARAKIDRVEAITRTQPEPNASIESAVSRPDAQLLSAGSVTKVARTALLSGAFTPDSAVFLGAWPFGDAQSASLLVIASDGSVSTRSSLGADELEIAVSLVDVCRQLHDGDNTERLAESDVAALIDWEAEIWRREMKR